MENKNEKSTSNSNTICWKTAAVNSGSSSRVNFTNASLSNCEAEGGNGNTRVNHTWAARESDETEGMVDTGHADKAEATGDVEDRCNEDVIKKSRAPDGGWGWMVALGTLIVTTILFSLPNCFGILFSGYLLAAGTSATTTAWIFNIFTMCWHLSLLFIKPLCQEFGRRTVGYFSTFMCSLSAILSAFSPSASFLYFSYSLMGGTGMGLCVGTAFTALPPYFDKKSGKANTFLVVGAAVSQMVFAPLLRYLLELYSYKGAALVYSGILLNSLIGVSFFHPVEWHLKPPSGDAPRPRQALMPQGENLFPAPASKTKVPQKGSTLEVLWETFGRVLASTKSDMRILRHYRAIIISVTVTVTQCTSFNFMMLLPFVVQAADHTLQDAAWCLAMLGVANFVTRLVLSPLADWKMFSIRFCIMCGYCLTTAAAIILSLTKELWLFGSAGVVFGVGFAASLSMFNLCIIKYMGVDRVAQTLGVVGCVTGIGFPVLGPLIGVIWDVTSSSTVSLWIMAVLDLASAGLWLLMPAAQARDAMRERTRKTAAS